jgi:hypothetical protein
MIKDDAFVKSAQEAGLKDNPAEKLQKLQENVLLTDDEIRQAAEAKAEHIKQTQTSIENTQTSIDAVRGSLGLSSSDEIAPSVKIETESLDKLNQQKDELNKEIQDDKSFKEEKKNPEKLRDERRMAIIKEIEKQWEIKNGPMERPLSEKEIADDKYRAELFGKKWDGRITTLTTAGRDFYFAFNGGVSVPAQADVILTERFPEYAKNNTQAGVEGKNNIDKKFKSKQSTEKTSADKLVEIFAGAGIKATVSKIEGGEEFSEMIILEKTEIPKEKLIRLYRGVNHLNSSVLNQIPYAMRSEGDTGKPMIIEDVRQEVATLANDPTYENLLSYVNKVRPSLSAEEVRRMDDVLMGIEEGILSGQSTRKELLFKQIEHNGGYATSGITPYISTTTDPYEAVGFGNEGMMVLDVPLSEIEDYKIDSTEVRFKGALDAKYITAILPRKLNGQQDNDKTRQEVQQATQEVDRLVDVPLYDNDELQSVREEEIARKAELDEQQWRKDVEMVRQKRVTRLFEEFPEVEINLQSAQQEAIKHNIDVYTQVKRNIFDYYKNRLEKIGRNASNIEEYDFSESEYGRRKKFDRLKSSDVMLLELKKLVKYKERVELNRSRSA